MGRLARSRGEQAAWLVQPRRQDRGQTAWDRRKDERAVLNRPAPLDEMHLERPVEPNGGMQAQRRGGRLVAGGLGTAEEDKALALLSRYLQAAQLFLPGLRQP